MNGHRIIKFKITNFRNINSNMINLSDNINCLLGKNGNGKTNLLEAIHFIANNKSFRKNTGFPQILSMDSGKSEILFSMVIKDNQNNLSNYSGKWAPSAIQYFYEGKFRKKRLNINTVFINPFDSFLFHNNASFRREWFDNHIVNISQNYKKLLKQFNRILKQRNFLLKNKPYQYLEQIRAIDLTFSEVIKEIYIHKTDFMRDLNDFCDQIFKKIFCESHTLEIDFDRSFQEKNSNEIYNALQSKLVSDLENGHTSKGPHRDDFVLLFDGLNSYEFCSLGQQKMAYLSLLFAYIELFRYKFKTFPIVLIDDVSGELDKHRLEKLIRYLEKKHFQVLITTANEQFMEGLESINNANKLLVNNGEIVNKK